MKRETPIQIEGQQAVALEAVNRWLADPKGPQIFRLFGWAGTGKTTLARHLAASVRGQVLFGAFTGKAAMVLTKKGCPASTLHSLIYNPKVDSRTGEVTFLRNPHSHIAGSSLLVVDEVSMVGPELGADACSYGTKILVLGDPFQLPPIKGEGYFTSDEPDILLTEIRRQAEGSPIIQMSLDIRTGGDLKEGAYADSAVLPRDELNDNRLAEADQVLCGMNRTRHRLNQRIRRILGLAGKSDEMHPTVGDRLVCLKNDSKKGLLNGGLWEVESCQARGGIVRGRLKSLDHQHYVGVDVSVPEEFFWGAEADLDWRTKANYDQFTFGWALTVHKAQGSQWDNVLLIDESSSFRENYRQWLYTGVTRAAERVTVILP